MNIQAVTPQARKSFYRVAGNPYKAKNATPFSIRLTIEERSYLQYKAGAQPLGAYIRAQLLEGQHKKRRSLRKPKVNEKELVGLLAALGQSRMSSNLNQLAKAANTGTLDVSKDIEQQLQDAYGAVIEMRKALLMALGLKS